MDRRYLQGVEDATCGFGYQACILRHAPQDHGIPDEEHEEGGQGASDNRFSNLVHIT